ncbi:MAG: Nif3-like dinuclear metal center hexameric protein [Archangium sp.]|nr:Nif3-like dinuclear metal center hexameric protein [Archangium sp.]
MQRDRLVAELDEWFRVADVQDDEWLSLFDVVYDAPYWRDYVDPAWLRSFNGLMVRGADEVTHVATCVFPSDAILRRVPAGSFVFAEHPVDDAPGDVFAPWSKATFERLRMDRINVYTVHAPLDHHPEVSPSVLLGRALGLKEPKAFLPMARGLSGGGAVIGYSDLTVAELKHRLQDAVGPEVPVALGPGLSLDEAGRRAAGTVAVVAGGGASLAALEAALAMGCTTYVTGNALSPCGIPYVKEIHDAFRARAKSAGVAIVDGTHYGTEKLSQLAMVDWFKARGLEARFEPGLPERR